MQESLMQQGLTLMAFGLGTVFVFLTVLVFATMLMSALIQRYAVQEVVASGVSSPPRSKTDKVDDTLVAVISSAVHSHRKRHGK